MMPLRDEAGAVVGFVKVLRDRTEQRSAAERLHASELRLRELNATLEGPRSRSARASGTASGR